MKKWFSLILAIAMCLTALPGEMIAGLAEESVEIQEPAVAFADDAGETGLALEGGVFEEADEGEAETEWPDEAVMPERDIYYARVIADGVRVSVEGGELAIGKGARVLVTGDAVDGRVPVSFVTEWGPVDAWIDAQAVEALTDEAADMLLDEIALYDAVALYRDMLDYPLPRVDCAFAEAENDAEAPSDDEAEAEAPADETAGETAEEAADEAEEDAEEAPGAIDEGQEDADETAAPADDDTEEPAMEIAEARDAGKELPRITLNTEEITIGVGETYKGLEATLPEGAEAVQMSWTSDNAAFASVNASTGDVKGVKVGEATVTVAAEGYAPASVHVVVLKAPSKIILKPTGLKLSPGMTGTLEVSFNSGEICGAYTFSSSNAKVVTVDAQGVVTAVAKGTATVAVKTYNGKKATCNVTVSAAPSKVVLSADTMTLGVGETGRLAASAKDGSGKAANTKFTALIDEASENPGCIGLNAETGEITALSVGTARVRVEAHNGVAAWCDVTVLPAPDAVHIDGQESAALTIGVKEVYKGIRLEVLPPEGYEACPQGVTWESSDVKTVKVDANGVITGVKAGTAIVTARTYNDKAATVEVTVAKAPSKVILDVTSLQLSVGMEAQLNASVNSGSASGTLTYVTSNAKVATVDKNGVISAVSKGTVNIAVKTYNGVKATCKVTVTNAPARVAMGTNSLTLGVDQAGQLSASAYDEKGAAAATDFVYTVSGTARDAACVEVDAATGALTGVYPGQAVVRVTAWNGVYDECEITVLPAPAAVRINGEDRYELTLGVKEVCSGLNAEVLPQEGDEACQQGVTWASSDAKTAKVDINGAITGLKTGTATITATTYNGKSAVVEVTVVKAPTKVILNVGSLNLSVGMDAQLNASVNSGAACGTFTYSSSSAKVAAVDKNGVVTALSKGTATITVKSYNGIKATCKVTVTNAPARVAMGTNAMTLGVDQPGQISASAYDEKGAKAATDFVYTVSGTTSGAACVEVDAATGALKGLRPGHAVVRVTAWNGVYDECEITVLPAPDVVHIDGSESAELTIGVKEVYKALKVDVLPPEGTGACPQGVTWTSSDTKTVKVDINGAITGLKAGKATVTATTYNGKFAVVEVTVAKAPSKVTLNATALNLSVGMEARLSASVNSGAASRQFSYSSNNASVATVDSNGLVTAYAKGTATITVKTYNGIKATCKVTVTNAPARVTMGSNAMTIGVDQAVQLSATAYDSNGAKAATGFTYEVIGSRKSAACVEVEAETGALTGLRPGSAIVRVTAWNGVYDECEITVLPAPAEVRINGEAGVDLTIGVKEAYTGLKAEMLPPEGEAECAGTITWESSNPKIAKVDSKGVITGVKTGKVVVTARTYNGKSAVVNVTVMNAPSKLTMKPTTLNIADNVTEPLTVSVNSGAASGRITFTSSSNKVATVDENGLVTSHCTGTATITATTYNGKTATCKVTVIGIPAAIVLDDSMAIAEGQTIALAPYAVDAAGVRTQAKFGFNIDEASVDPDCIRIDAATGSVQGLSRGRATVIVTTDSGLSTRCEICVAAAPEAIAIVPDEITLGAKESFGDAEVICTPQAGETEAAAILTWKSSKPDVAKVNAATGVITAVKAGSAVITATTQNGRTASIVVTVKAAPSTITLSPATARLSVDMELQLGYTLNKGAAAHVVTYTSSDENVATVTPDGRVTAISEGTATITAATYNGKKAKCKLTVSGRPASIAGVPETLRLIEGQGAALKPTVADINGLATVTQYTFEIDPSSETPDCVALDAETGAIQATHSGSAVIRVETLNHLFATCEVQVVAAPVDFAFEPETLVLGVGEKRSDLAVRLIPPEGEAECDTVIAWRTEDKKIAKVDAATGEITGVKAGSTKVYAATHNGIEKPITVTVMAAPTSVYVNPALLTMSTGMTATVEANFNAKAYSHKVTWTTSNAAVATVDENGLVTARGEGMANISAIAFNGKKGSCVVIVKPLPDQVFMTEELTLAVGMTRTVEASAQDINGRTTSANYTFTVIADTGDAVVDADGNVTGTKVGECFVKVESHNGVDSHVDIETGERMATLCQVKVVEAPAKVTMTETLKLAKGETYTLVPEFKDASGKTCEIVDYTYRVEGTSVKVDQDGVVTAVGAGDATVILETYNGLVATCKVNVPRYRLFAAYSYFKAGKGGDLYFTQNNALSMWNTFHSSRIEGSEYELVGMMKNPSKKNLLSGISNAFADSVDTDVNIVYLCSHGFPAIDNYVSPLTEEQIVASGNLHYGLQLPGYSKTKHDPSTYVTAEELFGAISGIRGNVILVLDSCYSGVFIDNMKSRLDAEGGRISVITAASSTKASYYDVKDYGKAVDFFTYFLLYGCGYDAMDSHMFFEGLPADANGDCKITLKEFFNYGKREVTANVPLWTGKSWFHGDGRQTPRSYFGNNANLVLFEPVL